MPKRKISKSRRDKRRTHWNLKEVNLEECPRCHEMKLP
ncbi:MAG: 50S ribosomal protein L32, partial [Atribacterota bacterium]